MTTTAEPEVFTSRIAEARSLLAAVRASTWPATREARAVIGQAYDYATGEIGVYYSLVSGGMDWTEFDADLMFSGGDPQAEAVAIAEARVLDAARAAMSRLAEYRRREAAMAAVLTTAEGEN